jgi:hypothetical protein
MPCSVYRANRLNHAIPKFLVMRLRVLEFHLEVDCTDLDDWALLIECLEDSILWEADWDMPELFLDVEPRVGRARKKRLGIDPDYFTALTPDPRGSASSLEGPAPIACAAKIDLASAVPNLSDRLSD